MIICFRFLFYDLIHANVCLQANVRYLWNSHACCCAVFKSGMYCSLFEVVEEKNKSGEGLAELFQELEKKELVSVCPLTLHTVECKSLEPPHREAALGPKGHRFDSLD